MKLLCKSFIFFAPFSSFLAVSGWLRIPVIIILITFLIWIIQRISKKDFSLPTLTLEDKVLLLFLLVVWISYAFGFKATRSFNHSLAWTFVIFIYYFLVKNVMSEYNISAREILSIISIASFVCCSIIIIDFLVYNITGFEFRSYTVQIPKSANMTYYGTYRSSNSVFGTTGGVAEEPGVMAFFLNMYIPLGLLHFRKNANGKKYYGLLILYVFAMVALGSSAGIVLALIFAIFSLLISAFEKKINTRLIFTHVAIIGGIVVILMILFPEEFMNFIGLVSQKATLSEAQVSSFSRVTVWKSGIKDFLAKPLLGYGPGYGKEVYGIGYLSTYLTIIVGTGIIGILLFCTFLLLLLNKLWKLSIRDRSFIIISFGTAIFHLIIISDFYQAPLWILFVLVQILYLEQRNSNFTKSRN